MVELWRQWMPTAYEQRWSAWTLKLYELAVDLEARQIDIEGRLRDRPGFVTAIHDATRIALGEHLEAKLEMLKMVLLRSALSNGDRTADLTTLRFLRLVDELEPEHVLLLRRCARDIGSFPTGERTTVVVGMGEDLEDAVAFVAEVEKVPDHVTLLRNLEAFHLVERKPPRRGPEFVELRDGGVRFDPGDIYEQWEEPTFANLDLTDLGSQFLDWLSVI